METLSSATTRVTRSYALTSASTNLNDNIPISRKIEDSEKGVSKSKPRTGALIDITNDSPIVGLAMGKSETPLCKTKMMSPKLNDTCTPGSEEALLRCQVKNLLQKVEEEAVNSKLSFENKQFLNFHGFLNSPIALLAPTPANTPQMGNLLSTEAFKNVSLAAVTTSPVQEQLMMSQMVDGVKGENSESEKNFITRSLLFDFSPGSDVSNLSDCSSVLTNEEDHNQSIKKASDFWSTQPKDDVHDEEFERGIKNLCQGISKISMNGVKFEGKHKNFIYNNDGEIEGEECGSENKYSASTVRLKGLPTPKGKHLRFPEDN